MDMSNGNWNQDEIRLAEYLVANVSDKASGRSESECVRNYPRDVYFEETCVHLEMNFQIQLNRGTCAS